MSIINDLELMSINNDYVNYVCISTMSTMSIINDLAIGHLLEWTPSIFAF